MKNVPDIRFKGFEDEWISVLFSNIAKISRGLTYSPSCINTKGVRVLRSSNIVEGNFCIFDNDIFVNEKSVNIPFAHNKDILITAANGSTNLVGKHCLINISNEEKFVHGGFMLIAKSSEPEFLHYSMFSDWYRRFLRVGTTGGNGAICNLNKTELAKNKIFVSKYKCEKTKLSIFFVNLDNNIKTLHKIIASLKQLKSACLISMFPQQGETVPRVRFKGFNGEWKKKKLNSFASRITRKNSKLESKLPVTISALNGIIEQTMFFNNIVASSNLSGYYLMKKGEFAYNKSYSCGFPFGAVKRMDRYEMGALSNLYIVFKLEDTVCDDYILYLFETYTWHKEVSMRASEGARNHGLLNIGAEDFLDIDIWVPNDKAEQHQIASYFRNLDIQISEQEKRLEKLKQIKAACLDKMFV